MKPNAIRDEKRRLRKRIVGLSRDSGALELAVLSFSSDGDLIDPALWRAAFESADARTVNSVRAVTGGFEAVVTNVVEVLKGGCRIVGLAQSRRPPAKDVIEMVENDGGLTTRQSAALQRLHVLDGRIRHSSPDTDADEVREAIEELRTMIPSLMRSIVDWFGSRGNELT